jgi:hypothetical protein
MVAGRVDWAVQRGVGQARHRDVLEARQVDAIVDIVDSDAASENVFAREICVDILTGDDVVRADSCGPGDPRSLCRLPDGPLGKCAMPARASRSPAWGMDMRWESTVPDQEPAPPQR